MIQLIKNQSVSLIKDGEDFNTYNERITQDNREFCQILHTGQTVQFQMITSEDSGTNLVGNGRFVTNLNSWTLEPNTAYPLSPFYWDAGTALSVPYYGAGSAHQCEIYQAVTLQASRTYKVKYSVIWGSTTTRVTLVVQINNANQSALGGQNIIFSTNQADGNYEYIFRTGAVASPELRFIAIHESLDNYVKLDNVGIYELTEPVVTVKDCEDNHLDDVNTFTRWGQYITATYEVTGFDEGQCLKFCFEDSEDGAFNFLACNFALLDQSGRAMVDENGGCLKLIN